MATTDPFATQSPSYPNDKVFPFKVRCELHGELTITSMKFVGGQSVPYVYCKKCREDRTLGSGKIYVPADIVSKLKIGHYL